MILKNNVAHTNIVKGIFKPLNYTLLGYELEFGEQKKNGLILLNDDMSERGIKPRLVKIYKVGNKIKDLEPGNYVILPHGRWSTGWSLDEGNGPVTVRFLDYKDILMVFDEKPYDYSFI